MIDRGNKWELERIEKGGFKRESNAGRVTEINR